MQKPQENHSLKLKIGSWFEASANGKFAIVALVFIFIVYLSGLAFGFW